AHVDGAPDAHLGTVLADVTVKGTKLVVTASDARTDVEVLRGLVAVTDKSAPGSPRSVAAGQEAALTKGGAIDVAPASDLAQRVAFGQKFGDVSGDASAHNEDADAPVSGLGE